VCDPDFVAQPGRQGHFDEGAVPDASVGEFVAFSLDISLAGVERGRLSGVLAGAGWDAQVVRPADNKGLGFACYYCLPLIKMLLLRYIIDSR
jgi:hypothetical protein